MKVVFLYAFEARGMLLFHLNIDDGKIANENINTQKIDGKMDRY